MLSEARELSLAEKNLVLLKEAEARKRRLYLEHRAAMWVVAELKMDVICDRMSALGINVGDDCLVNFAKEDVRRYRYEGVRFESAYGPLVVIRHYTKRGRRCKNAETLRYGDLNAVTKAPPPPPVRLRPTTI